MEDESDSWTHDSSDIVVSEKITPKMKDEMEQVTTNIVVETQSRNLLAVLDDKNKMISLLKRQLQNQKIQLGYYLHRALSTPKILQLAKSCLPQVTDENIHLTLAMNNFYKQTGFKSRILSLHERMTKIDKRIFAMVELQEALIKQIIEKIITSCNTGIPKDCEIENYFSYLLENPGQFRLFTDMLNATFSLRKELDTFRICCNRLIAIEDERNALVEQVYSTPIEERMNCNYIIAVQLEKRRLQLEMEDIRNQQKMLQEKVTHMKTVGKSIKPDSLEHGDDDTTLDSHLHRLLETVNSDAVSLLTITKEQKEKFTNEIEKLMDENCNLKNQLTGYEDAINTKAELERRIVELEEEYTCVIKQCKYENQMIAFNKDQEIHQLKFDLQKVKEERNLYKEKNEILQEENSEAENLLYLKEEHKNVLNEREFLRKEVKDLQHIRDAYTDLLTQMADDETEHNKKLQDAKKQNDVLSATMKRTIISQQSQIKYLINIMEKISEHIRKQKKRVRTPEELKPRDISLSNKNFDQQSNISYSPFMIQESGHNVNATDNKSEIIKITEQKSAKSTSFEICTTGQNGMKETVKAVLEYTTSVEGLIQMSNNLSLRVNCKTKHPNTSPIRHNSVKSVTNNNIIDPVDNNSSIDEYELMKDCSRESLSISTHQCKSAHTQWNDNSKESIPKAIEMCQRNKSSSRHKLVAISNTDTHTELLDPSIKISLSEEICQQINSEEATNKLLAIISIINDSSLEYNGIQNVVDQIQSIYK